METHNRALYRELNNRIPVHLLANRRGFWFLPFFLLRAWWVLLRSLQPGDRILFGDLATAVIIPRVGLMGRNCKWFSVAHGLDVVWANPLYQALLRTRAFRYLCRVIAVSEATSMKLGEKGFAVERVEIIGNGVSSFKKINQTVARSHLSRKFGLPDNGNVWLLSIGRLVQRKGLAWFIRNVYSNLPQNVILLIAGQGPDAKDIRNAANLSPERSRVYFLGRVSEESKHELLNGADIFIMPNQKIEGDIEGFGITILEAASAALPVVATNIDGIREASGHGRCARLVQPGNPKEFACELTELIENGNKRRALGEKASRYVRSTCSWERIGARYLSILEKIDDGDI